MSDSEQSDMESSDNERVYELNTGLHETVDLEQTVLEDSNKTGDVEENKKSIASSGIMDTVEEMLSTPFTSKILSETTFDSGFQSQQDNIQKLHETNELSQDKDAVRSLTEQEGQLSENDINENFDKEWSESVKSDDDLREFSEEMDKELLIEQKDESEKVGVMGSAIEETSQDTEEDSVSEYRPIAMSEDEMNRLLERLTSEQEEDFVGSVEKDHFLDNIEPPVYEGKLESGLDEGNSSDEPTGSDNENEDSSIDSDISGDEPVEMVWHVVPQLDDLDSLSGADGTNESQELAENSAVLSGYTYCENTNTKPAKKAKVLSKVLDGNIDQTHVKFYTPTSTIFYDPESPIIERVSVQVSDDLIDYDDGPRRESKESDLGGNDSLESFDEKKSYSPQAFSLYKPKDDTESILYTSKDDRDEELQGAMELIQDTGLEELKILASQISRGDRREQHRNQHDIEIVQSAEISCASPMDTDEVVSRRKNDKNVADEDLDLDRCDSLIIHDDDMPCSNTTEYQTAVETVTSSSVGQQRVGSMIIHEEENLMLTEALHSLDEMIPDVNKELESLPKSLAPDQDTAELDEVLKRNDSMLKEMEDGTSNESPERKQLEIIASSIASSIISSLSTQDLKFEEKNICELPQNKSEELDEEMDEIIKPDTCFDTSMETTIIEAASEERAEVNQDVIEEGGKLNEAAPCSRATANDQTENVADEERKAKEVEKEHETEIEKTLEEVEEELVKEKAETEETVEGSKTEEAVKEAEIEEGGEETSPALEQTEPEAGGFSQHAMAILLQLSCEVLEIIYWRDVRKTGMVFGSMLFVLVSLCLCSLLSVLAYLSLAILTVTFSFRVYKSVMQAVQKNNDGHPFKKLLDFEIQLKEEVVEAAARKITANINNCCHELRRLYLVGDYIDSLKFGLLLWLMTYIGAWFNGMTLVILVVVSTFTLPKVYETYQGPIDQNVNLVRAQLNNIMAQVSAKIPFPKKKAKTQ